MFMQGCLFPESVLGCVTFSVTHQPAFRVPAGSELLITAPSALGASALFYRRWQLVLCLDYPLSCPLLLANNPLLFPPRASVPFAETVILEPPQRH